jgi:sugar phosphate isomerase/epimerase
MGAYSGPGDLPWPDLRRSTASNLAAIGQIGRSHGVSFYLEALAWAEIRTLPRVLEVIDAAEQDNIGLALDFWHLWNAGATPGEVAKLDGGLIRSVDFCDSLGPAGTRCGPDQAGRDVWTGGGAIPLSEWVAAVRATGYVGWWSCELLSPKYWELDPFETARELRELLLRLLA